MNDELLATIEAQIAADPRDVELRYQRAWTLEKLARTDDAKNAYLDVLRHDPAHFGAINNLGSMLFRLGFARDAAVLYAQAVKLHPDRAMGHINLGNAYFTLGEYIASKHAYAAALALAPDDQVAHHGLGNALSRLGQDGEAQEHFARAFRDRPAMASPHLGVSPPIRVLTLFDASMGNLHAQPFFNEHTMAETKIAAGFFESSMQLPPHDVIFNAIGDADRAGSALKRAVEIVARSNAPVVNHPARVLATRRADVARYASVPGVIVPATAAYPRSLLTSAAGARALRDDGFAFPLLVRAPGYHNGEHFALVESAGLLAAQVEELPGELLLAIAYVDTRGADGAYRKYRAILVDGRIYPLHLAISPRWKVHFHRADTGSARNREEDAAFLRDMNANVGERAMRALAGIADLLQLDYGGIDFGLDRDGRVVLFEANATMVVPHPPAGARWEYRRAYVARIREAMRALIPARLRQLPPTCAP